MDPAGNILLNMSYEQAQQAVLSGDASKVAQIDGQFAICVSMGKKRSPSALHRPANALFLAEKGRWPRLDRS